MGYGIKVKFYGDYACFTRPEMKVERVSYDVITPSAARGMMEAIYWRPAIRWVIDKIHVMNEIQFTNIRRNETSQKISASKAESAFNGNKTPFFTDVSKDRQQRATLLLKDVCYIVEAHFEMTEHAGAGDTPKKHYNIAVRRLKNGQCHHQPCFGTRELSAHFEAVEDEIPEGFYKDADDVDLGWMLWDIDFQNEMTPIFFRATMKEGKIDVEDLLRGR